MITACEVIDNSPSLSNVESKLVNPIIDTCVRDFFCESFVDDDLQELMENDLQLAPNWCKLTNYSIGDKVMFRGRVYLASQNSTGSVPNCSESWTMQDKFNNTCYNDLWEKHLLKYLALTISTKVRPMTTYRNGAGGTHKYVETNQRPVNVEEINLIIASERSLLRSMRRHLASYMKSNSACFEPNCVDDIALTSPFVYA